MSGQRRSPGFGIKFPLLEKYGLFLLTLSDCCVEQPSFYPFLILWLCNVRELTEQVMQDGMIICYFNIRVSSTRVARVMSSVNPREARALRQVCGWMQSGEVFRLEHKGK